MSSSEQFRANGGRGPASSITEDKLKSLGPWFQNLHLPGGVQTVPDHPLGDYPSFKWKHLVPHLPADLTGWTALDVGCNAGFYCFELARRNARVVGIDNHPVYLAQARWAAEQYGLADRVEFRQMQVYDLARLGQSFDLVLFMGVFYHLRYSVLGLDVVAQCARRLLVFQSLTMPGLKVRRQTGGLGIDDREALLDPAWPKMAFFEHDFMEDRTNWWAPNHACVEALLRSSGLRVRKSLGHEMYLCEPDPRQPSYALAWNREEYCAALGLPMPSDGSGLGDK